MYKHEHKHTRAHTHTGSPQEGVAGADKRTVGEEVGRERDGAAVVNLTSTFVPGTPAFATWFALASSSSSERACRDTGQTTGAPEELEWDIWSSTNGKVADSLS